MGSELAILMGMTVRLMTVSEAAERLGVVPQRVRALAQAGALEAIRTEGVWLIDPDSLARRVLLADLGVASSSVRPWSQPIAWAAMRALDDDEVLLSGLDRKARYRLRRRLDGPDPARLLSAVRNRARVVRASVHPSRAARLRDLVIPSGITGAGIHGFGLTGDEAVDGYLSEEGLADANRALRVRSSDTGAHLLRVVDDARLLEGLEVAPRLAVAVDLLDHAVEDGVVQGRVVSTVEALLAAVSSSSSSSSSSASSSA
jgi:excisionase family DNA binding protein